MPRVPCSPAVRRWLCEHSEEFAFSDAVQQLLEGSELWSLLQKAHSYWEMVPGQQQQQEQQRLSRAAADLAVAVCHIYCLALEAGGLRGERLLGLELELEPAQVPWYLLLMSQPCQAANGDPAASSPSAEEAQLLLDVLQAQQRLLERWHRIMRGRVEGDAGVPQSVLPGLVDWSDAEQAAHLWRLLGRPVGYELHTAAARLLPLCDDCCEVGGALVAVPGELHVPAGTLSGLLRLLRHSLRQCHSGGGAISACSAGAGEPGSPAGREAEQVCISALRCMQMLVYGRPQLQLSLLEAGGRVLAAALHPGLPQRVQQAALELLVLVLEGQQGEQRAAQLAELQELLVLEDSSLPASLVGLLQAQQQAEEDVGNKILQQACAALSLLVIGSAAAQLAVASLPGAAGALVGLLGSKSASLANEAAATLAALQRDSGEARSLLLAAGRGVPIGSDSGTEAIMAGFTRMLQPHQRCTACM